MRIVSLLLPLLCVGLASACSQGSAGSNGASAPAAAVVICGDRDEDGRFETADIQGCIDEAPPEPVVIELLPGLTYEAPLDPGRFDNAFGFVELESAMTLDCRGSRIRGIDAQAKVAPNRWGGLIVVTNSDHIGNSQHDVWVRNCEIDGGMPSSYDEDADPFDTDTYLGFALYGVTRGGLTDSRVHDTHHACVYVRNSKDILVENNQLESCGGANNLGSHAQPAVYLYQSGSTSLERVTVRDNRAVHAGSSLYNTRVERGNAEYQTAWMRDVVFEGNYGEQLGNGIPCLSIRGAREIRVSNNTCVRTGGLRLSGRTRGFCSENPPVPADFGDWESGCVQNAVIEGNTLIDSELEGMPAAITIFDYHENVRLIDNAVVGARQTIPTSPKSCFAWQAPVRGLVIDRLDVSECEGAGVDQLPHDPLAAPAQDAPVVFSQVAVQNAGWMGVLIRTHAAAVDFDGLTVGETRYEPVLVQGPLARGTLRDFVLDGAATTSGSGLRVDSPSQLFLEEGRVRNVVGAGVHLAGGPLEASITNLLCDQPLLGAGIAEPMSYCLLNSFGPGLFSLSGVSCGPGAGSVACVSGFADRDF